MERRVYRVSQVNRYVRSILSEDRVLSGLWISGEISNFKRHSSGHLYFTMKDAEGAVSAVMFAADARKLTFRPYEGMMIEAYGYISLYEKTGSYQFYVREISAGGEGALYQAYLKLKDQLERQGLFDASHKKELPSVPMHIGLVTSGTGAAVRDMIEISRRRFPGIRITLCPVQVQGIYAAQSIASGIRRLNRYKDIDVIIVGRGGGSIEDLWAFNEEITVRAVYESRIPIVSAVGHETDVTLTDFAADLRASTPSAAAELVVPEAALIRQKLVEDRIQLGRQFHHQIEVRRAALALNREAISPMRLHYHLDSCRQRIDLALTGMENRIHRKLESARSQLILKEEQIRLMDPMRPLDKGYSILMAEGKIISSTEQTAPGMGLEARVRDGSIHVIVAEEP